ncbi:unnamed protein product [Adineta ricciae]|uniref:G-protein coupled receptors family 1 profile domain-containing protein n=1 Tax=Adineta ricciae TaxID=249248 RepID=A0A814I297_ADIRI|nr:unnamed protein product [Adineta ricciae]CAF1318202.1 unnamed protein product [Adineta ricciae]
MNNINITTYVFGNTTLLPTRHLAYQCPDQRAITRPLLFVHNYSLFVFGSILNILAFFILMQGSLRCHSTFAYLAFLSLSNGLSSLVRFIRWMFSYYLNIQADHYLYTCRLSHFSLDFLTHFSLLTLVCVNIDRAQTVTRNRPNTKFSSSTFRRVLIKELLIAVVLSAYHFHWLVKFGYEVNDGKTKEIICNYEKKRTSQIYFYFLSVLYRRIELFVFFCFPLFINILCTILIVRSLHLRMRTAKRFNPYRRTARHSKQSQFLKRIQHVFSCLVPRTTTRSNIYSCFGFRIQCRRHTELRLKFARKEPQLLRQEDENDSNDRQQSLSLNNDLLSDMPQITTMTATILNKTHRSRRIRDIHLSAMLIVLNILYLIFNLPFNLYQNFVSDTHKNPRDACVAAFTYLLLDTLQQTYFSTNFFLYVLTNRRFREEFTNTIIKLCTRKQEYLLRKSMRQRRARSLSLIPSTAIITNFNGDYQANVAQNRDSIRSDIELTQPSTLEQQTILTEEGNSTFISKLVALQQLSDEHV